MQHKLNILNHALDIIPNNGFVNILPKASIAAGYDENFADLIFTNGTQGLIELFVDQADFYMLDNIDLELKKIPEKAKDAILKRIDFFHQYKKITKKLLSYLLLPFNISFASKLSFKTADIIWNEILNDQSTDFNYYTKRSILALIYNNTLVYSMHKDSSFDDISSFLTKQMEAHAKFHKIKSRFF